MAQVDNSGLIALKSHFDLMGKSIDIFFEDCDRELAARLLNKVIKRTPVGVRPKKATRNNPEGVSKDIYNKYWKGYQGGTLRRGWTAQNEAEAESGNRVGVAEAVKRLSVDHVGNGYNITVRNCVNYASYVEYGHRQVPGKFVAALGKKLKASWVTGQFMLANSVNELEGQANEICSRKLRKYLKDNGL